MQKSALFFALLISAAAFGPIGSASHFKPSVPCTDPRGCPDLVVDRTRLADFETLTVNYPPTNCAVAEGSIETGPRRILRFTFNTPNIGDGDLIVGKPADHPDWFEWAECHKHHHFREYADYRLWTVEGYLEWDEVRKENPDQPAADVLANNSHLRDELLVGRKQGFCVIDIVKARPTPEGTLTDGDETWKYGSCSANQGISRGWADEYDRRLTGQWVEITNVSTGTYILEAEVNPEHMFVETNYTNNRGAIPVFIR